MGVRANVSGFRAARRFLERTGHRTRSTGGLTRKIGAYGRSSTVKRIRSRNLGRENAPVTRAVKRGGTPLMDTGSFVRRITYVSDQDFAAWGSGDKQAALLQTGGTLRARRADKLAFPASRRTRRLQRRYGFGIRQMIARMRKDGYRVWFLENAIMAQRRGKREFKRTRAFVLFIRTEQVTIPAYRPFRLDATDHHEILRIIEDWLDLT